MGKVKSVAVIGAGPGGAIAVDALAQEKAFDVIRVFERREKAGGCWVYDEEEPPVLSDFDQLSNRTAGGPIDIPDKLPGYAARSPSHRFTDTAVYPALETNVDAAAMSYSQEHIPEIRTKNSINLHGPDTPFRHHTVIRQWVEDLLNRNGYQDLVEYNTTVEKAVKDPKSDKWVLTLRRGEKAGKEDYWWIEEFDALVVASGHYSVPYIPHIKGLKEFAEAYPGSIEHTKGYRHPEKYRGKRVITVGASVSGADTAVSIVDVVQPPVYAVVRGKYNVYFGDEAFKHPNIERKPAITHVSPENRTVYFEDGTSVSNVDYIIFGTGFTWNLPFLPDIPTRNNRIPDLYLHIFYQQDPTLTFVGAVGAGLTFKVFEWQAVLAARVLAGKVHLPPLSEQQKWERDRIAEKGDGPAFTVIYPRFEEYFETLRKLAGNPKPGEPGRRLPEFDPRWVEIFNSGHERRKAMWRRKNEQARKKIAASKL
ncbi:hypothetical protein DTO271G3_8795 [Paecilomyces variotii]|nr:hypothetical protein DTO271G3_8795 [Paecilomyces variotii]